MLKRLLMMFWRGKLKVQRVLLAFFSAVFSLLLFLQVCFRYVLDIPLFGLEEVAVYLALWVYFIGASYACHERYHISASLVDVFFAEGNSKKIIDAIAMLIGFVILLIMAWWCLQYLLWSAKFNMQSVELGLPMAFINSISFIGLALSAFYLLLEVLDKFAVIVTGNPLCEPPKPPLHDTNEIMNE